MTAFHLTTNSSAPIRHTAARDFSSRTCRIRAGPFVAWVSAGRTGRPAEETEPDMSTTTQTPTHVVPRTPATGRAPVWKHGVVAAAVASLATTVLAALASAAGVSFADSAGAGIPIAGFAQLTLVFSLVGVGMAAVMARKARRPRSTFVRTTLALTALSVVPDLTFGFGAGSALTLVCLHIVAAAIVVPTLARRLARTR